MYKNISSILYRLSKTYIIVYYEYKESSICTAGNKYCAQLVHITVIQNSLSLTFSNYSPEVFCTLHFRSCERHVLPFTALVDWPLSKAIRHYWPIKQDPVPRLGEMRPPEQIQLLFGSSSFLCAVVL
ncbi:hypothetical protein CDAR_404771 [Caerostris darwini]|uniref:Uncharacterized protein n=1 Tax=Caerostris darwini TaxID=1538125 RepID=A0AAV4U4R7_9ARAC|nr:hypothetical protein CDAR_404771 [Caerostris darwini]